MIGRLLFFIAFFTSGSPEAQITVRSGEHQAFTRLVFYLDSEVSNWDVRELPRAIKVGPSARQASKIFYTGEVFRSISRNRVESIIPNADGVIIHLACQCGFKTFNAAKDILVIDVLDERGHLNASNRAQLSTFDSYLAGAHKLLNRPLSAAGIHISVPTLVEFTPQAISPKSLPQGRRANVARDQSEVVSADMIPGLSVRHDAFSVGIDLRIANKPSRDANLHQLRREPCFPSINRPTVESSGQRAELLLDVENRLLDLAMEPLKGARSKSIALARAYLSIGFGAEAARVISASGVNDREAAFLSSVSRVVDFPNTPTGGIPLSALSCDEYGALWSFLSNSAESLSGVVFDSNAILDQLSHLPQGLRARMARAVTIKFRRLGMREQAAIAFSFQPDDETGRLFARDESNRFIMKDADLTWQTEVARLHFRDLALGRTLEKDISSEDRALIEGAIKDSADATVQESAIQIYVAKLVRDNSYLPALRYLDRMLSSSTRPELDLDLVVNMVIEGLAREGTRGEILAASAVTASSPWFMALDSPEKARFVKVVSDINEQFLDGRDGLLELNRGVPPASARPVLPGREPVEDDIRPEAGLDLNERDLRTTADFDEVSQSARDIDTSISKAMRAVREAGNILKYVEGLSNIRRERSE